MPSICWLPSPWDRRSLPSSSQKDVALVEGATAFVLLVTLQFCITWPSVQSATVRRLVKAELTLLLYQGSVVPEQLRRSRVLEAEVYAAVREQGIGVLSDVHAVVLKTDGSFAVVSRTEEPATALAGLTLQRRILMYRTRCDAAIRIWSSLPPGTPLASTA